ncbi:Response regulator receiver domain-containing protein [Flaviramulus basaltis]|uniref:Response regulator receiver domain-containing protein n=1 Tax=Flaviramulus basaltis TaxID=369401 RepID=A0A1K2IMQ4_9FLAO|nr:response regulator [Flaviramulus basaltis]SFZ93749.1 Response regulator receiver domain-containing protein [Flaviramulus basaltis]
MKKIDIACIIDDDPIFVFGIKKMMQFANFCESFMIFKNGEEALNNLKAIIDSGKNIPDVILLDINMPVMDGWQFLDEFIKIESHKLITVYIVSSSIDPRDKDRVKNYENVSNFIVKPISIESLKNISKELLNN